MGIETGQHRGSPSGSLIGGHCYVSPLGASATLRHTTVSRGCKMLIVCTKNIVRQDCIIVCDNMAAVGAVRDCLMLEMSSL